MLPTFVRRYFAIAYKRSRMWANFNRRLKVFVINSFGWGFGRCFERGRFRVARGGLGLLLRCGGGRSQPDLVRVRVRTGKNNCLAMFLANEGGMDGRVFG